MSATAFAAVVTVAAVAAGEAGSASGASTATPTTQAATDTAIAGLVEVKSLFEPPTVQTSDTATAVCPGEKVVVGTGFLIADPNVVATGLVVTEKTVKLRAHVDTSPNPGPWSAQAMAYCADRPKGYVLPPLVTSVRSAEAEKTVFATCPGNTQVLGTSFDTSNGNGRVVVDEILPSTNKISVKAFDRTPGNRWRLHVGAICAAPLDNRTVVTTSPVKFNSNGKAAEATCPIGTQVINNSFDLIGSLGQVNPTSAIRKVISSRTSQVAGFEAFGTNKSWAIRSFAVCA
ncbi:hypothetical protein ACQPXM_11545 [Kribbella sp. CA-253562]|uniref:hypothetical protein n=1 Tax=Kribbella sp. CA-253562 TaxID=3239942 RepID=UPI003D8E832B